VAPLESTGKYNSLYETGLARASENSTEASREKRLASMWAMDTDLVFIFGSGGVCELCVRRKRWSGEEVVCNKWSIVLSFSFYTSKADAYDR